MTHHVLLAGLFHETHTFLDHPTPLSDWTIKRGEELFEARGDASPLAGVLSVADQHNWRVTPTIDMRATPSGPVDDEVLEVFWDGLASGFDQATTICEAIEALPPLPQMKIVPSASRVCLIQSIAVAIDWASSPSMTRRRSSR